MNSLHSVLFSLWPQSRFQPQKDCFIFSVTAFERLNQDDIFVVKLPVTTACKPETLAAVWSLNETRALPLAAHCQNKVCVCTWAWMSMSSDYAGGSTRQGNSVAWQSEWKGHIGYSRILHYKKSILSSWMQTEKSDYKYARTRLSTEVATAFTLCKWYLAL